jgi:peroxiredoxin
MLPLAPATSLPEAFQRARDWDAPLGARLKYVADSVRLLNPPFALAIDNMIGRLQAAGAGATAPAVGEPMPPFLLPDETGRLTSLEALIEAEPVALAFHRGHWCPYCRLNSRALADAQRRLRRGRIVAITPDRRQFASQLKTQAGADFPVLIDIDNGYALSLNLAVWVGEEMERMMSSIGAVLPSFQGNDAWILPVPATFIIGTDGLIAARYVDPDYRLRMDVDDLTLALETAP